MKKTVILLLAALLLPLCQSIHAQRRSDYNVMSDYYEGSFTVQHEPWTFNPLVLAAIHVPRFDYIELWDNIPSDWYYWEYLLSVAINPTQQGDPDGTLSFYPVGNSPTPVNFIECMSFVVMPNFIPDHLSYWRQPMINLYDRLNNRSSGFGITVRDFNMLGENLFANIPALEQAQIKSGVRHLLKGTFRDCKNLKYVKFGPNVIKIDQDCFLGCSGLEVVEFENSDVNSVPRLKDDIKYMFHTQFHATAAYCTNMKAFVVPDPLVSEYKTVLDDVFKPVKDGTCRVMSRSEFYGSFTGELPPKGIDAVIMDISSITLSVINPTYQFTLSYLPPDAYYQHKEVTWSSSDTSVVSVDQNGLITYKSPGTANIVVTTNDYKRKDTCTVIAPFPPTNYVNLKNLSVPGYTFSQAFNGDITAYTVTVPSSTASVNIVAEANTYSLVSVTGTGTKTLEVGDNVFSVVVNSGFSWYPPKTYTVTVHRKSVDATLKSFTLNNSLNNGNIPFGFNPATLNYTVTVSNSVSSIMVAAAANYPLSAVDGDTGNKTLNAGDNRFAVTVTPEEGQAKTYTITVHRKSVDATLKSFTLNNGDIPFGFNPATLNYTVTVSNSVTGITVAAAANYHLATVTGDTGNKTLNVGDNLFTVTVTPEEGQPKIYTIVVHRRKSADAILQSLTMSNTLNGSNISMEYNPEKLTYTATVPVSVKNITLNARANHSAAFVTGHTGIQSLRPGRNIFHITVTAEDGTVKIHPVIITVVNNVTI